MPPGTRKTFSPHSRQQDEREITRRQGNMPNAPSFGAGMFADADAEIPQDGVVYLRDFINRVKHLIGRGGSKRWGDWAGGTTCAMAPLMPGRSGLTLSSTVASNVRTVTNTTATKNISNITLTSGQPVKITIATHGYSSGAFVYIASVTGTTELNTNTYQITVVDANSFSLIGTDGDDFTAYVSGGTVKLCFDTTDDGRDLIYTYSGTTLQEEITGYTDQDTVTTRSEAADTASAQTGATGSVGERLNCNFYHAGQKKFVILVGTRIYVADDLVMSAWTEATRMSLTAPNDATSWMEELKEFAILYNSAGIFKIDLSKATPEYYQANSREPTVLVTDTNTKADATPVCRRVMFTMGRLSGTGNRNRNTSAVSIEQESAVNQFNADGQDYGEVWMATEPESGAGTTISSLTVPTDPISGLYQRHWTHYLVHETMNIGTDINDSGRPITGGYGNSPQLFMWSQDVPICKAFTASIDANGNMTISAGAAEEMDIGSTLKAANGTLVDIATFTDGNTITVFDNGGSSYTGGVVASTQWTLGGADTIAFTQSAYRLTKSAGTGNFASGDEGKPIFSSDGKARYITAYVDKDNVDVNISETIASAMAGGFNPTSRKYHDITTEAELDSRIKVPYYRPQTRLFSAMPACNFGVVAPGVMLSCVLDATQYYYCLLPDHREAQYLGYHDAELQTGTVKGGIVKLIVGDGSITVRTRTSTTELSTNTWTPVSNEEIGQEIQVLATKDEIDSRIGGFHFGGSVSLGLGDEVVVTSEKAIRRMRGRSYEKDMAGDGRLTDILEGMQPEMSMGFHPSLGVVFYMKDTTA